MIPHPFGEIMVLLKLLSRMLTFEYLSRGGGGDPPPLSVSFSPEGGGG